VRRCPSTSAPLLLGCLRRAKELVIGSVELGPLPMHRTVGFCRNIRLLGKIQKSGVGNAMTYRLPNSRKSNFATEPSGVGKAHYVAKGDR
jgi:hypothetical protein